MTRLLPRSRSLAALAGAAALGVALSLPAAEPGVEPISDIDAAARAVALAEAGSHDPATVEVHSLDPRLRFAACQRALAGGLAPGMRNGARMTIEVRCDEPHWRVYVGVTLHALQPVVVASRPLSRQTVLGPDDLTVVERDLGSLPGGFYKSAEALYGTLTARTVGTGEVLTPAYVDIPPLIRRGQTVTVLARRGPLEVRQSGVALADAGLSQRIRVQTESAAPGARPIEAVVRGADLVEVALP